MLVGIVVKQIGLWFDGKLFEYCLKDGCIIFEVNWFSLL